MKIKMIRESGMPVKTEQISKFREEFKAEYDNILENVGGDMKSMQKQLDELDEKLANKYDTIYEVNFPTTSRQMRKLINEYGNIKSIVSAKTGELVFIITDLDYMNA